MKKVTLISLAFLLIAGMLMATMGCGGSEIDLLREDVSKLRQQLLREEQESAQEKRISELVAAIVEEELSAFEAKLAEKAKEDRLALAALEKALFELQRRAAVHPQTTVVVPVVTVPFSTYANFEAKVYKGDNFDEYIGLLSNPYPINFNWGRGGPLNLTDDFSVRWQGVVYFEAGTYRFFVRANEGVRLYVDGCLLLNRWGPQGTTEYEATTPLSAGSHQIQLDYREVKGPAEIFLTWTKIQ